MSQHGNVATDSGLKIQLHRDIQWDLCPNFFGKNMKLRTPAN